jgi:hypothetical protein
MASPEGRWLLKKRRIALGLYLAFLAACVVGTQGPWWQVVIQGKPLPAKYGGDVDRFVWVETDDPAQPQVQREVFWRKSVLAVCACVVAFFFASYNLVADTDLQAPVLVASLAVCGVAAWSFYDIYVDQSVIEEFVEVVESRRVHSQLQAGAELAGDAPERKLSLRLLWGLALFVSASLVMLVDSLYMTFVAQRTLGESS